MCELETSSEVCVGALRIDAIPSLIKRARVLKNVEVGRETIHIELYRRLTNCQENTLYFEEEASKTSVYRIYACWIFKFSICEIPSRIF